MRGGETAEDQPHPWTGPQQLSHRSCPSNVPQMEHGQSGQAPSPDRSLLFSHPLSATCTPHHVPHEGPSGSLLLPPLCSVASSNSLPSLNLISPLHTEGNSQLCAQVYGQTHTFPRPACLRMPVTRLTCECHTPTYAQYPLLVQTVFCLHHLYMDVYTHVCTALSSSPVHAWDPSLTLTFVPYPWQTIEFDGSAGAVLRIQPLRTPRDENVYECVAQNSVGEITVHAKLTVLRGIGLPGVGRGGPGAWTLGTNTKGIHESLALDFLFGGDLDLLF